MTRQEIGDMLRVFVPDGPPGKSPRERILEAVDRHVAQAVADALAATKREVGDEDHERQEEPGIG